MRIRSTSDQTLRHCQSVHTITETAFCSRKKKALFSFTVSCNSNYSETPVFRFPHFRHTSVVPIKAPYNYHNTFFYLVFLFKDYPHFMHENSISTKVSDLSPVLKGILCMSEHNLPCFVQGNHPHCVPLITFTQLHILTALSPVKEPLVPTGMGGWALPRAARSLNTVTFIKCIICLTYTSCKQPYYHL
jgi:hypothetical protein